MTKIHQLVAGSAVALLGLVAPDARADCQATDAFFTVGIPGTEPNLGSTREGGTPCGARHVAGVGAVETS